MLPIGVFIVVGPAGAVPSALLGPLQPAERPAAARAAPTSTVRAAWRGGRARADGVINFVGGINESPGFRLQLRIAVILVAGWS